MYVLKRCFSNAGFKVLFSILFLSIPGICLSSSCKDLFVSGGEGVINYVRVHTKKSIFSIGYDEKWEQRVKSAFESWNLEDIERLLTDVESRIGVRYTLEVLRYPDNFLFANYANYEKFKKVISFYDDYLGAEVVTKQLRRSMEGFFIRGSFEELKGVMSFLESYIGREGVKQRMEWGMGYFANVNLEELKGAVSFLEGYIGREGVKQRMESHIQVFAKLKLSDLQGLKRKWETEELGEEELRYRFLNYKL